tara:strand:- start:107 stop:445 length:339 start_codon:yes stop_codon:yes gene_type:complete
MTGKKRNMTRKNCIALAQQIRSYNRVAAKETWKGRDLAIFKEEHLIILEEFLASQSTDFYLTDFPYGAWREYANGGRLPNHATSGVDIGSPETRKRLGKLAKRATVFLKQSR